MRPCEGGREERERENAREKEREREYAKDEREGGYSGAKKRRRLGEEESKHAIHINRGIHVCVCVSVSVCVCASTIRLSSCAPKSLHMRCTATHRNTV